MSSEKAQQVKVLTPSLKTCFDSWNLHSGRQEFHVLSSDQHKCAPACVHPNTGAYTKQIIYLARLME